MNQGGALQAFVAKWYQHEPEMQIGETFAGAGVELYRAWGALQHELLEAAFGIAEPAVARTKLAWWGEDLARGSAAGHPIARALHAAEAARQIAPAHWRALAQAAVGLRDADASPRDDDEALAGLRPLAASLARIEQALFGGGDNVAVVVGNLSAACLRRALAAGQLEYARMPLTLLAKHQTTWSSLGTLRPEAALPPVMREHAGAIARHCVPVRGLPLLRGLRTRCDRAQVAQLQRGAALQAALQVSPWRALWLAWNSARLALRPPVG